MQKVDHVNVCLKTIRIVNLMSKIRHCHLCLGEGTDDCFFLFSSMIITPIMNMDACF